MGPCSLCSKLWKTCFFTFTKIPKCEKSRKRQKLHQSLVYFCSCDRGFVHCISALHPLLWMSWGGHNTRVKPFHEIAYCPGLASTAKIFTSYSIRQKHALCLLWAGSAAWDIYSLGTNASTCPAWDCGGVWSTVHGATRGSSGEKRMPWVLHTSLQHQENNSPLNQPAVLKAELWEPQGNILT